MNYANLYMWSDAFPYEIVRRVSEFCLEIRAMDAVLADTFTPNVAPGGFCGHTTNNNQQDWTFLRTECKPIKIRKRKDGQWYSKYGRHVIQAEPIRFHDYNF
jgi:hypothetical protein